MPQRPALTPSQGLAPFNLTVSCPMCGFTPGGAPSSPHMSVKWCSGTDCPQQWTSFKVSGCLMEGEHIHRICPQCGYELLQLSLA